MRVDREPRLATGPTSRQTFASSSRAGGPRHRGAQRAPLRFLNRLVPASQTIRATPPMTTPTTIPVTSETNGWAR